MAVMDSDSRIPLESQMNMMFSPTKNIETSSPLSLLDTVKLQLQNIINIPEILINAVSPQQFTSRMTNQRASATLEGLSLGLRKLDSSKEDPFNSPLARGGVQRVNDSNLLQVDQINSHDYSSVGSQFFSFGKRKCSEAVPATSITGLKHQRSNAEHNYYEMSHQQQQQLMKSPVASSKVPQTLSDNKTQ